MTAPDVRVMDLVPGDVIHLPGGGVFGVSYATFVTQLDHPRYLGLKQVVWKLEDGSWSFDALDPRQVVGERRHDDQDARVERLREVLGA